MRTAPLLLVVLLGSTEGPAVGGTGPARVPVLVELFTSEGCSSCPPADAVLERLLRDQPVSGTRVIALGEHVDYWDDLGWKDRYSSPAFTARQAAYVRQLGLTGPYTPQLVVGGRRQVVGSDARGARAAISQASRSPAGTIALRVRARSAGHVELAIEAAWSPGVEAEVTVATVQDRATSAVARGENAGRTLTHVAIARSLEVVGAGRGGYAGTAAVAWTPGAPADRVVVFVQERGGAIAAVESIGLAP